MRSWRREYRLWYTRCRIIKKNERNSNGAKQRKDVFDVLEKV